MIRKIIKIDESKCNGCGLCAGACQEGAIAIIDGKAKLVRDDYCDGLGNCLPACPTGAISFEEREAAAFDEQAVKEHLAANQSCGGGCPGTKARAITQPDTQNYDEIREVASVSRLRQWPVQIELVPVSAPYFDNANLLIAADCTAYAYGDFHNKFIKNRITLIGCPKLDDCEYADKLTEILKRNRIKSVTVVRMEVPCCGGLEYAVRKALENSKKIIPWQIIVISTDGQFIEE